MKYRRQHREKIYKVNAVSTRTSYLHAFTACRSKTKAFDKPSIQSDADKLNKSIS